MTRYLAHAVIHAGTVYRQSIVGLDDGVLSISRFDREVHSTVFVSGIVIVVAENKITLSDRQQLEYIFRKEILLEGGIKRVMRYLERRDIFASEETDVPSLLVIER
ncbi:hypothetical protein [uncultured Muribaculum sp.]|uniref:hypothetical protein n=1 Tax=uncultured Muribaculum sp. TaxID=1918613 RepID=UPI002593C285|nr:hypothetical protein [uncultured Muribaculum sp.]